MSTTSLLFVVIVAGVWQGALCDNEEKTGLKFRITDKFLTKVENVTKDNDLMITALTILMKSNPKEPLEDIIAGIGHQIRPNFSLSFEEPGKFHAATNNGYFEVNYRPCTWEEPLGFDVGFPPYVAAQGVNMSFNISFFRTEDNKLDVDMPDTRFKIYIDKFYFRGLSKATLLDPAKELKDPNKLYSIGDRHKVQVEECLQREREDYNNYGLGGLLRHRINEELRPKLQGDYNSCNDAGYCRYFGITENLTATSEYMEFSFSGRPSIVGQPSGLDQQFQPTAMNVDMDNSKMFYVVVNEKVLQHNLRVAHAMNRTQVLHEETRHRLPGIAAVIDKTLGNVDEVFGNLLFTTLSRHLEQWSALPNPNDVEAKPLDVISVRFGDSAHPDRHIILSAPIKMSWSTNGTEDKIHSTVDLELYFNVQIDNSENLIFPLLKIDWHVTKFDLTNAFATNGEISISDQVKAEISEELKNAANTFCSTSIKRLEEELNGTVRLMHRGSAQNAVAHAMLKFFAAKNAELRFTEGNVILDFDLCMDPALLQGIMPRPRRN